MTCFYADAHERPFAVTLLAMERLGVFLLKYPLDKAAAMVLADIFSPESPDSLDVDYFLGRVVEEKEVPQGKPKRTGKPCARGEAFRKTLVEMPVDRLLILACHGDYERARKLYCEMDKSVVSNFLGDWVRLQVESFEYVFEAALYAGGGRLKSDDEGDALDATTMSAADLMKQFGAH